MWGVAKLSAFLVIIFNGVFVKGVLEKVFQEIGIAPLGKTDVKFVGSWDHAGRSKREVEDCFADILTFNITLEGTETTFELKENLNIAKKPMYLVVNGTLVPHIIPSVLETACYQDIAHDAAIGVSYRRLSDGTCQYLLEGSFASTSGACVIYPTRNHGDVENHVVGLLNSSRELYTDYVVRADQIPISSRRKRSMASKRFKRNVSYGIELFLFIDSLVYEFWFQRGVSFTPAARRNEALASINQYYAYIVNGVDLRYKNIAIANGEKPFQVFYAGMFVSENSGTSPFTTGISTPNFLNSERPFVDADIALDELRAWIAVNNIAPNDHVMLFSKADFRRTNGDDIVGLAFLESACRPNKVSLTEDLTDFITIDIAAHELGHSLGAQHDGLGNLCSASDNFVMSPSVGGNSGDTAFNPWIFSSCSIAYFQQYILELDAFGINCLLEEDPGLNLNALDDLLVQLPGQFYDIDDFCRIIYGPESFLCREEYNMDYTGVCLDAFCLVPDRGCFGVRPGRGTSCGDSKWCIDGACVLDPAAPSGPNIFDSCPLGDDPGVASGQSPCNNVGLSPRDCYQAFFNLRCCLSCTLARGPVSGCEYGDHIPNCVASECGTPASDPVDCCGTCGTPPTTAGPVTTNAPTTTTTPECLDQYPTVCPLIARSDCYVNEAICCSTCLSIKQPMNIGCEYGDRILTCVVSECGTPASDPVDCCETCATATTAAPTTAAPTTAAPTTAAPTTAAPTTGAPTTAAPTTAAPTTTASTTTASTTTASTTPQCLDQYPTVCPLLARQDCYVNEAVCCISCLSRKQTSNIGCEYGDRISTCLPTECGTPASDPMDCCETCASATTSAPTTAAPTTAAPTTAAPTTAAPTTAAPTTTTPTTTATTPQCLDQYPTVCPLLARQDCYVHEPVCCISCLSRKQPLNIGCEYGDRISTCLSSECGSPASDPMDCCETCASSTTSAPMTAAPTTAAPTTTTPATTPATTPQCLDQYPTVCPLLARQDCYVHEAVCCISCLSRKQPSNIGCEYGDRISTCVPSQCDTSDPVLCCETCAPTP